MDGFNQSEYEMTWRNSLTIGSKIDFLWFSRLHTPNYIWCKGEIIDINKYNYTINNDKKKRVNFLTIHCGYHITE